MAVRARGACFAAQPQAPFISAKPALLGTLIFLRFRRNGAAAARKERLSMDGYLSFAVSAPKAGNEFTAAVCLFTKAAAGRSERGELNDAVYNF